MERKDYYTYIRAQTSAWLLYHEARATSSAISCKSQPVPSITLAKKVTKEEVMMKEVEKVTDTRSRRSSAQNSA